MLPTLNLLLAEEDLSQSDKACHFNSALLLISFQTSWVKWLLLCGYL